MRQQIIALCVAALVIGAGCTSPKENDTRDVTVVVAGDLHFDLPPETDQYYHVVTMNRLEGNFTFPTDSAAPGIAGETVRKLDGVILAGDMFDKARPEILTHYRSRYEMGPGEKTIHYPVYPGFGNHDIDPAVSDKGADNLLGRAFSLHYLDSILNDKLAKGEILNLHPSSRSYSWNIQDVHFVQAQRFSGDTAYCESNLDWLADDLKRYASEGNPVVYIQHYGVDPWAIKWWPQDARNRLFDILDNYNVAAFLVGHTHEPSLQHYRGYPIYQVNNAWPDEDGNGSFAVVRLKGDAVSVASCRWTDDKGNFEVVGPYLSDTLPRIIDQSIHYNAFSHNDYWRENPLEDALAFRFNCVEADLWLIDGELYVSHERPEPNPAITFENLYLKPLIARIQANGGKVYPDSDRPFYLMVDCKAQGEEMYKVLKKQMEPYKEYFCSVENGEYKEGAVLFFLSGDRPAKSLPKETSRFTFLDGQIKDLGKGIPASLAPVVSDNYADFFTWNGEGEMPEDQLNKMREIIEKVHEEGKLFRWWGAPDTEVFKRFFIQEGVDLVGADELGGLYNVLDKHSLAKAKD